MANGRVKACGSSGTHHSVHPHTGNRACLSARPPARPPTRIHACMHVPLGSPGSLARVSHAFSLACSPLAYMLVCALTGEGRAVFLKNKFGLGYYLYLVKLDGCVAAPITAVLNKHIPDLEPSSDTAGELTFRLPLDTVNKFGPMLGEIEARHPCHPSTCPRTHARTHTMHARTGIAPRIAARVVWRINHNTRGGFLAPWGTRMPVAMPPRR